ncbi:hypothetical protein BDZ90DRAFT_185269 [Jaminaea rosea]|uniref:Uncharacterized protein n=1 Tax=Jaminaea rosea TaxID=1569628 RepID=A0A316UP77_9BASI|nr:hypothetical protein BDZ90DRAFT_185269 [Jaminaea rosea]PWN27080.1 hypothetical protein BDZ90DRAFT_185269 [Jaminaea rosea]
MRARGSLATKVGRRAHCARRPGPRGRARVLVWACVERSQRGRSVVRSGTIRTLTFYQSHHQELFLDDAGGLCCCGRRTGQTSSQLLGRFAPPTSPLICSTTHPSLLTQPQPLNKPLCTKHQDPAPRSFIIKPLGADLPSSLNLSSRSHLASAFPRP